jgi:hypothetical protein
MPRSTEFVQVKPIEAVRELSGEEKTCPMCAETVKAAALICKHCKHTFDIVKQAPVAEIIPIPKTSNNIHTEAYLADESVEPTENIISSTSEAKQQPQETLMSNSPDRPTAQSKNVLGFSACFVLIAVMSGGFYLYKTNKLNGIISNNKNNIASTGTPNSTLVSVNTNHIPVSNRIIPHNAYKYSGLVLKPEMYSNIIIYGNKGRREFFLDTNRGGFSPVGVTDGMYVRAYYNKSGPMANPEKLIAIEQIPENKKVTSKIQNYTGKVVKMDISNSVIGVDGYDGVKSYHMYGNNDTYNVGDNVTVYYNVNDRGGSFDFPKTQAILKR